MITEEDILKEYTNSFFNCIIEAYHIGKNHGTLNDLKNMLKNKFKKYK